MDTITHAIGYEIDCFQNGLLYFGLDKQLSLKLIGSYTCSIANLKQGQQTLGTLVAVVHSIPCMHIINIAQLCASHCFTPLSSCIILYVLTLLLIFGRKKFCLLLF